MRQVGPDHMQSEDLTQPRLDLCSITKSGRGMETVFLSRSNKNKQQSRGEDRLPRSTRGTRRVHDTEKWRKTACLPLTGLDVSQSSDAQKWTTSCRPRETPLCATYLRVSIGADGRNLWVLGLDLNGRGRPDDRMPASLMRRYYITNSRRSSPTSGTLTD